MTRQQAHKKRGIDPAFSSLLVVLIFSSIAFTACSPSVHVTLSAQGSGKANFTASLSPTADTLIRRFSSQGNANTVKLEGESSTPLFDKKKIEESLLKAGIQTEAISFPKGTEIALLLSFKNMNSILNNAISITSTGKEAIITMSPKTVLAAIEIMPEDTKDYLDLLMAPIFTKEELSTQEYVEIISMTYGKTLAHELTQSLFTFSLSTPSNIKKSETSDEKRAFIQKKNPTEVQITIPLAELLTLQDEILFKISW